MSSCIGPIGAGQAPEAPGLCANTPRTAGFRQGDRKGQDPHFGFSGFRLPCLKPVVRIDTTDLVRRKRSLELWQICARFRAPSAVLVSVVARRLLVAHTRAALSSVGIAGTSRRKGADLILTGAPMTGPDFGALHAAMR